MSSDPTQLSVAAAAAEIRRRTLSPLELTKALLGRIERLNPKLNAYITVTADRALDDARRATDEIAKSGPRGPLHGIPVALKDLYATAGIRTTGGAKILSDWVPREDSTVARLLREAGTILLGKLNTHEYAYGVTTNNPHYGPTRNPWDLERIPGGSSGGSGAAVAAGIATVTMGTDTGGSIRIPASLCGVVGLKPTYGRVSKAGVLPLSFLFDHTGPLAQTVEDAAIVLQAIAGYDASDAATVRTPVDDYRRELDAGLRGLRVGVPRAHFFEKLDPEVAAAVEKAIAVFRDGGATVRDVEIPAVGETILALFALVMAEAQEILEEPLRTRRADFGADVLGILSQPAPAAIDISKGLRAAYRLTESARSILETVDVLLMPTTPIPAPKIGEDTIRGADGKEQPVIFSLIQSTAPFNASRLPALSLPCGFTEAGLPIGLQIVGRPFDEATVLRAGQAYEKSTDWHRRRPPFRD